MFQNRVFCISLLIVVVFVLAGVVDADLLDRGSARLHGAIIAHFGWAYMLSGFFFLVFCVVLALSRYGGIKLGRDHEKPVYTYFGWFSMLFAAGMGIGLIFWGVAEPLSHYMDPPEFISPETGEAATFAMRYSYFHWGLHPWAIYIVMSLGIAYFSFRRGMPPLISSCFYPMLGDRIYGPIGHFIDILAVFATIFGIATSLGLGAIQINSGLEHLYGLPSSTTVTLLIILGTTMLFMISAAVGLDKGIQTLSKTNIVLAFVLLLFMLVAGPTSYMLNVFTDTIGGYIGNMLEMSLAVNPFLGQEWYKNWTLFYWAWWIAWSPFVGIFVARISRGRTIREFISGALLVPALLTFAWFSVFGGASLFLELEQGAGIGVMVQQDVSTGLFLVFDHFPGALILSNAAILLLIVFFVTSADSATFVLGIMTSNGSANPPLAKKIVWGITQSSVAAILLVSGGLAALQRMAITAALPFNFVLLLMCYNIWKALASESRESDFRGHVGSSGSGN
ncbi:glycine betaine uptake BCCT transporter [Desulfonatronum thioautotrophicum]|uniref:glycine betaine uptake BCCT transporter n=1 Tax=Desulfonatronum thioautotrophicum TaxID=617001 RepID=UPI0005EAEB4B|nr:BCCT family transporter [Desulfonatronum thioautotrophicum]